jgi:hypothetical protein
MRLHFLFAVVGIQILVFQFVSVRFLRAIPGYVLGETDLPEEITAAVYSYRKRVGSWSYPVGAFLLAAMTLCVYVIPFATDLPGALIVTAASLLSSGFFVWTYFKARSAADSITEKLPDPGVRVASLERRKLRNYYNVGWELGPFVVLAASIALTLWALPNLGQPYPISFGPDGVPDAWGEGAGRFLFVLFLQVLAAFGLLLLTLRLVRARAPLSPKAPSAAADPEAAGRLGEGARRLELRFFMAAKMLIALKFLLILFVKIETALGVNLPWWGENSPWAMTGLLLILFLFYIHKAARRR